MKQLLDKIHFADSAEFLKQIDSETIDLVVTSPPYDNLREYNNSTEWNFDKFKAIALELNRILAWGGVICWNIADQVINGSESLSSFKQAIHFVDELKLNLHDTMIYLKNSPNYPETNRYGQVFEYMFIFSKGTPKTFNPIKDRKNKYAGTNIHGTNRNKDGTTSKKGSNTLISDYGPRFNVWQINSNYVADEARFHPASFPIDIPAGMIETWTNEGDIVLDPFSGSGTTAIAAHEFNRKFITIENDEAYYQASIERLETHKNQLKLF